MLDLHFVRENLETVRKALETRNFPTDLLDHFAEMDAERRRVISESDQINAQRNSSSKEIGALMQSGKHEEAEAKKAEVAGLKDKQAELEHQTKRSRSKNGRSAVASAEYSDRIVPIGTDETANVEIRKWSEPQRI